jgi:hypothetical protein
MSMPSARTVRDCSSGDAVILWFVGAGVLAVWNVFHDARFDNRLLIVGLLLPDLVDAVWGGARGLHSITGSVALLVGIMLATYGRRPIRRRLLAVPIGTFLHLVFDGAFNNTKVFWWPFTGASFDNARLPIAERGMVNVALEIVGVVLCVYAWRIFGLGQPERRRTFIRTGSLVRGQ